MMMVLTIRNMVNGENIDVEIRSDETTDELFKSSADMWGGDSLNMVIGKGTRMIRSGISIGNAELFDGDAVELMPRVGAGHTHIA